MLFEDGFDYALNFLNHDQYASSPITFPPFEKKQQKYTILNLLEEVKTHPKSFKEGIIKYIKHWETFQESRHRILTSILPPITVNPCDKCGRSMGTTQDGIKEHFDEHFRLNMIQQVLLSPQHPSLSSSNDKKATTSSKPLTRQHQNQLISMLKSELQPKTRLRILTELQPHLKRTKLLEYQEQHPLSLLSHQRQQRPSRGWLLPRTAWTQTKLPSQSTTSSSSIPPLDILVYGRYVLSNGQGFWMSVFHTSPSVMLALKLHPSWNQHLSCTNNNNNDISSYPEEKQQQQQHLVYAYGELDERHCAICKKGFETVMITRSNNTTSNNSKEDYVLARAMYDPQNKDVVVHERCHQIPPSIVYAHDEFDDRLCTICGEGFETELLLDDETFQEDFMFVDAIRDSHNNIVHKRCHQIMLVQQQQQQTTQKKQQQQQQTCNKRRKITTNQTKACIVIV